MVFATCILVVRLIAAQSAVLTLWFCRRCYERSRGEMITMIYEKTLTRKSFGTPEGEKLQQKANGNDTEGEPVQEKNFIARFHSRLRQAFTRQKPKSKEHREVGAKQPASMGKILNLMR